MFRNIMLILACLLLAAWGDAKAGSLAGSPYEEMRYCGPPKRGALGEIIRDQKAIYYFRKIHKCPSTGLKTGACPGWSIDHPVPLACGGCDAVSNMAWMPNTIKTGKSKYSKDRWERKVYARPDIYDGHNCKFEVIPSTD
jgi:hypothetical protein